MKLNLISPKIIKSSKSIEAEVGGGNSLWISSQFHCHFDHFYCREVRLNTPNVSFYIYYWLRQNSHNRLELSSTHTMLCKEPLPFNFTTIRQIFSTSPPPPGFHESALWLCRYCQCISSSTEVFCYCLAGHLKACSHSGTISSSLLLWINESVPAHSPAFVHLAIQLLLPVL